MRELKITEQKVFSNYDLGKIIKAANSLQLHLSEEKDCHILRFSSQDQYSLFSIRFFHNNKDNVLLAARFFLRDDFFLRLQFLPGYENCRDKLNPLLLSDILEDLQRTGSYRF